jgi:hypothetical protein
MMLWDNAQGDWRNKAMNGDATMTKAGLVTVTLRSAADCTAETGGVTDELCVDSTAGAGTGIWRCPSPGDCSTTTAWERADDASGGSESNDLETDDPPNVENDEVYIGSASGVGSWVPVPDCNDTTQKLDWNAGVPVCVTDQTAGVSEDAIGTTELDDGADTPGTGDYLRVDTVDQAGVEYRTTGQVLSDIGAAASTHGHTLAGVDFQNQGTTTTVLHGNAAGNPSFGAITSSDIDSSIATTAAGLEQFGQTTVAQWSGIMTNLDLTLSELQELETLGGTTITTDDWIALQNIEGVNTGDNDEVGAVTSTSVCQGDGSDVQCDISDLAGLNTALGSDVVTGAHFAIAGTTFSECFPMYAPSAEIALTDDVQSVWRAAAALTITEVWCETDTGTVTMDLQIDSGSTADVVGTDLVCATTAVTAPGDEALAGDVTMADGDRLDFLIDSVGSNPTRLSVCIEYDFD